MRLEHHLVGGYVRYISPYIIHILLSVCFQNLSFNTITEVLYMYGVFDFMNAWSLRDSTIHLVVLKSL